jgi:hypothetical protein
VTRCGETLNFIVNNKQKRGRRERRREEEAR